MSANISNIPKATGNNTEDAESLSLKYKEKTQNIEIKGKKYQLAEKIYKKLFWAICVYIFLVLVLMLLVGNKYLNLSDSVLITLLTTTTANIIGVFAIASKWLYFSKKSDE